MRQRVNMKSGKWSGMRNALRSHAHANTLTQTRSRTLTQTSRTPRTHAHALYATYHVCMYQRKINARREREREKRTCSNVSMFRYIKRKKHTNTKRWRYGGVMYASLLCALLRSSMQREHSVCVRGSTFVPRTSCDVVQFQTKTNFCIFIFYYHYYYYYYYYFCIIIIIFVLLLLLFCILFFIYLFYFLYSWILNILKFLYFWIAIFRNVAEFMNRCIEN